MPSKQRAKAQAQRCYWGADVPMRLIRRFARQVAERFAPEKIILFGSHAYGTPHADSDVDILVVMRARNEVSQASRIRLAGARIGPWPGLRRAGTAAAGQAV